MRWGYLYIYRGSDVCLNNLSIEEVVRLREIKINKDSWYGEGVY